LTFSMVDFFYNFSGLTFSMVDFLYTYILIVVAI
jgi:hypothetical protein